MRTTLTLDDQLANTLKERAHRNRIPFKDMVNQALSLGLGVMDAPPCPEVYRLTPASMGGVTSGIPLGKALTLADTLEDAALFQKLEQRK